MSVRVACVALFVQVVAANAHADPVDDSAAVHLERGIAAYRARDFGRAMAELLQANRQAPDLADALRWIALTEAEIDDCRSALINIEIFVPLVPADDPRVPELVAVRDRCRSTGNVTVDSTPSGAAVRVDRGPVIGATPVTRLAMRAGHHTLSVEKPGFEPQSRDIDVRALANDRASFALGLAHTTLVTQRWWFWVGVGVATIGLTALALDARPGESHPTPTQPGFPSVTCNASGCHP